MNESTTPLPSGTWTLNPAATTITVTAQKMKFITVPATLAVKSGTIEIANGSVSRIEVVADAASYKSSMGQRDKHVRSSDFLDVEAHPNITFSAQGGDAHNVAGTVEIKGLTSPIDFAITDLIINDGSASFNAAAVVDRKKAGVDKMPTFVISQDLVIAVTATATKAS